MCVLDDASHRVGRSYWCFAWRLSSWRHQSRTVIASITWDQCQRLCSICLARHSIRPRPRLSDLRFRVWRSMPRWQNNKTTQTIGDIISLALKRLWCACISTWTYLIFTKHVCKQCFSGDYKLLSCIHTFLYTHSRTRT